MCYLVYRVINWWYIWTKRVTQIRSINVGGYRHNYEDFYKKSIYQISISRERMTTAEGAHASLVGILSFLLFLS